ncbi:TfuA-like protein [Devosia sp. CN2-171]|uniref:TfuA-like protein n=1 Tax=Devosia sp. CN2-171 TaxID=3400909 RepID=UPI003BF7ABF0
MKVLFAGPSLWGVSYDRTGLDVRPPARQGDIHRAVVEGAEAIGLIDGVFGFVPSVWHKEILFALKSGVRVMGAASLGALRAVECAPFGMEVIGSIATSYAAGSRIEDADVCLVHAPAELDFMPLTEPLVDVEATLEAMRQARLASTGEAEALLAAARSIYFADRTVEALTLTAGLPELAPGYREARVGAKSADALLLVEHLRSAPRERTPAPDWELVSSDPWRHYLAGQAVA